MDKIGKPRTPPALSNATPRPESPFHAVAGVTFQWLPIGVRIVKEHRWPDDACIDAYSGCYENWDEEVAVVPHDIWSTVVQKTVKA